ncbi:MAG: ABC transporter permease [Desulfuromonadales bacterium]|nr:ABC transporter permease [Desulfuromonadales bacterium]
MKGQNADPVTRLGLRTRDVLDGARAMTIFTGSFLLAAGAGVRRPRRLRLKEILAQVQRAGADAMVLLACLSLLMGFVLGIQAMVTMALFGAEARIAQVVTIVTMQEIGPLLTAILLAGRSGIAFVTTIATMKSRGEIDALQARGRNPVDDLVLPRVLALMLAGPLLAMITTAASILGGMVVTLWIPQLSLFGYLHGAMDAMSTGFLLFGLAKMVIFSGLVGLIGCFQGLRMGGPDAVEKGATSSFVIALLLIILVDALFNFLYHLY